MTNRTPRCNHRGAYSNLHNERLRRHALEQQLRVANERILELQADVCRHQEAEAIRNNARQREHEEHVRIIENDHWRRVATIQLQALNRENQLNARIAELEQTVAVLRGAEVEPPEDPNPANDVELPLPEGIVDEDFEEVHHDDNDVADNLPEGPFEADVARVENVQN